MYRMATVAGGLSLAASDHLHTEITKAAGAIIDALALSNVAAVVQATSSSATSTASTEAIV
jgi:hypothetical protein